MDQTELPKKTSKSRNDPKGVFPRVISFGAKFIDYKIAVAGALFLGIVVFCINYFGTANAIGSLTAALKQATYTFLFGGIIMKTCERLAVEVNPANLAITLAIIIPSFVAITLTFAIHSLRGTPEPVQSTLPTAILIIPSTLVWSLRKRKRSSNNTK